MKCILFSVLDCGDCITQFVNFIELLSKECAWGWSNVEVLGSGCQIRSNANSFQWKVEISIITNNIFKCQMNDAGWKPLTAMGISGSTVATDVLVEDWRLQRWQDKYKGSADAQWHVVEVKVRMDAEGTEGEDGGQEKGYTNSIAKGAWEKMCWVRQMHTKFTAYWLATEKERQITHPSR